MAANWLKLPALDSPDELDRPLPEGWRLDQIENLYEQLPIGKRFDQKSSSAQGHVPVIDQSEAGVIGWHDEEPGVIASESRPVVTFANHTCEMRWMRRSFSVIQNVFPLIGKTGVCDTRFLYYGTKGRVYLEEYKGHFPDYRRKWIPVPPLPEQRAIAHILGTLDDKIELNRRMNETLEAMARALFKSWFVDFGPVRAKAEGRDPGLPKPLADLFPARFVDSELGEIPEGWEVQSVGDHMVNFDSKRVPVSGADRSERQGPYPYHGAAGVMDYVDDYLFDGIHVLVGEDGSVVQNNGMAVTQYVWGKIWVNNHAHVLQGRGAVSTEQLYLYFHFEPVAPFVTGAVQPKLSQGRMNAMPFVIAGEDLCRAFGRTVQPLFARLRAGADQTKTLVALRDALLPKLISSELRVKDAGRQAAAYT
jgi:type I restriction enzyme, S subunit